MIRIPALALAASLLAGCVTTGPDGQPVDNTPGLVIIGFVYTGEHRTPLGGCPLGRNFGVFTGPFNLDILKLDANNRTNFFQRQLVPDGVCQALNPPPAARYNFMTVSPGRHLLGGITNGNFQTVVRFINAPVITVAPGEVVYVGDVTFDGLFERGSVVSADFKVVNTEADARAALGARGIPPERMVVRPLEITAPRPNYQ